jgi:hypothetical protein
MFEFQKLQTHNTKAMTKDKKNQYRSYLANTDCPNLL